ncbi:ANK1 [Symbiodinium sp. CCMP2592]|nr:ANK1 [Symbiodinium sp. CCMP2592]
MYSEREAARSLLHSCLSYSEEANTTVRPFNPDLLSLPSTGSSPPPLQELVDDFGREILKDPVGNMMLSPDEWGAKVEKGLGIAPYMDVVLKHDPGKYVDFVRTLYLAGMLAFTAHPKDLMTPFFVAKKSGKLRLVLDCRGINQRFKEPPSMMMAAGSSWSQLELPEGQHLYIAQSDITDYFYSLRMPEELQPYFCLPSIPSEALDAWMVHPELRPAADREGMVFPCFRVVPMGWSWAMYWAQRVHQLQALLGSGLTAERLLVAERPAPPIDDGQPLMIAYADNLNVAGTCPVKVQEAKDNAAAHLRSLGFGVHEELDACTQASSLGFFVDGVKGVVTPKPDKVGKVVAAFRWLSRRPRVPGKAVEKLIGHAVHFMMLWTSAAREAAWVSSLLTVSDIGHRKESWRFRSRDFVAPRKKALGSETLDPFIDVDTVLPVAVLDEDPFSVNPGFNEVPTEIMEPNMWACAFAARMTLPEPITVLEARGTVAAIRHTCRNTRNFGKRHVHINDNLANVLCFEKGRSASFAMLRACRRACALLVACNIAVHHRWALGVSTEAASIEALRSLQAETKEGKAQKRQKLMQNTLAPRFGGQTFLEQVAVSAPVGHDYSIRLNRFVAEMRIPNIRTLTDAKLDEYLSIYLNNMFKDGCDVSDGNKTLASVLDARPGSSVTSALPRSRRCLKGWANMDPGKTRPPIPFPVIALIVLYLMRQSLGEAALLILLMFSAYLRPGEALALQIPDVVKPSRTVPHYGINLHPADRYESSKVGLSDESILLDSPVLPLLGLMLSRLIGKRSEGLIFEIGYPVLLQQ